MRTEEDEAFDDLARKQGAWGGGFPAKRAMAADKLQEPEREALKRIAGKLRRAGASIPAPQVTGTIEGSVVSGLCVALAIVEGEIEALAQPAHCQCTACKDGIIHASDCAVHNGPAYPAGECDCGVAQEPVRKVLKLALEALETERDIYCEHDEDGAPEYILDAITSIKAALAQPAQEAIYGMNQDDWKDVVAAVVKVRDGRGIYLGCRPADVFQDWFLALGTAKLKEKNNG
jgi:hypothetical protein